MYLSRFENDMDTKNHEDREILIFKLFENKNFSNMLDFICTVYKLEFIN